MSQNIKYLATLFLSAILTGAIVVAGQYSRSAEASPGGFLFVGSDTEEFHGLPDQIGKYQTDGPNIVGGANIPLVGDDKANGMTAIGGQLLTGTVGEPFTTAAEAQTLTLRDLDTVPQDTFVADIPTNAFNEDLAYDGVSVWRAHFLNPGSGSIRELDPSNLNGPALNTYNLDFGPVGMTFADGQLWITAWAQQQVGTWDPLTNVFTPVFDTQDLAGCLAFDEQSEILWVGLRGGLVVPHDLDGNQLGAGFQPFGDIPDTIDGCAFVSEEELTAEKFYTFTNLEVGQILDDNGTPDDTTDDFLRDRTIDEAVLPEQLPTDEDGVFQLEAVIDGKGIVKSYNPGQYYAFTVVNVTSDADTIRIIENFTECVTGDYPISEMNPKHVPGGAILFTINPDGSVTDLSGSGALAVNEDFTSVEATLEDVPADTQIWFGVKFSPGLKGLEWQGPTECHNTESVFTTDDPSADPVAVAEADLAVTEK